MDQKTGRALGDGKGGVWGFGFDSAGVRAQRRMRRLAEADLFEPPMWRMRLVAHWSAAHTVGRGIDGSILHLKTDPRRRGRLSRDRRRRNAFAYPTVIAMPLSMR